MLDKIIEKSFDNHVDTVAAFVGGATVSVFGIWHIDPAVIVGKIAMTFLLGLFGGFAGITAKWLCNKFLKSKPKRNEKSKLKP